jgi:hypothetical protein
MSLSQYTQSELKQIIKRYNSIFQIQDYYKSSRKELEDKIHQYMDVKDDNKFVCTVRTLFGFTPNRLKPKEKKQKTPKEKKPRTPKEKKPRTPKERKPRTPKAKKPEPKPEPEPESEPESDPEPEVEDEILMHHDLERDNVYSMINIILHSKKTYSLKADMVNKYDIDPRLFDKIMAAFQDFDLKTDEFLLFPPIPLMQAMFNKIYENQDEVFLDANCGIGFVIHLILKINPRMKIFGYESNPIYHEVLEELFPTFAYPNVKIYSTNILDAPKTKHQRKYQSVFCNPPFVKSSQSKEYMLFVNKCVQIVNDSKDKYPDSEVFFVSHPEIKID